MSSRNKDTWVRIIDVSDPVLHSKKYTLYKVTSKVFPKNSVEAVTEVTVWKRYNDFKKLHKDLSTIHQNLYLKGTFPSFAKTRFFGRFDPTVIEERRQSALQLLQFAASSFPLFTSQVFVKFFEEGHILENIQQPAVKQELSLDDVLQPQSCQATNTCDKSVAKEDSLAVQDSGMSLGGIWQHHQVPDNISLGSECTDDDDRTTFTDDDSVLSRPSLDVAEFDPLLQPNLAALDYEKSISNHVNICNSWLLSALDSCNDSNVDKDHESISEFPTPFGEFEFPEDCAIPSNELTLKDTTTDSNQNYFTYDLPAPTTEGSDVISEFDTLIKEKFDSQDSKEDVFVCDEFAMTPNAYQNESDQRPSYIVLASNYVESAKEAEEEKNYMTAFEAYKKAIEVLLQGIQKDKCSDLKDAVRKKVLLYLMRAEELYENKLPKDNIEISNKVSSPLPPLSRIKSVVDSVEELNKYKVIGILDKTLLVLDVSNNETFVAKTLYKRSSDRMPFKSPKVPQSVPFMVKLHHVYETSYAMFLILEHATGGRLWNYVMSFFQRRPLSPLQDGTCLHVESKTKAGLCNVYSGKKISGNSNLPDSFANYDCDLTPSENCPSSYIALFKNYADAVNKEENVSLAKYHKFPQNSSKSSTRVREHIESNNEKDLQQNTSHINVRNRLSSSTGSLDTGFSQKASVLDAFHAMDEVISQVSSKSLLPESCIVLWAAEIVLAFEHLHDLGIIWRDFHPNNILLGAEGHILLTYQRTWNSIDFIVNESAKDNLFCAPEVGNIFPVTPDCDWWSLGAILFELLTGQSLVSCYPTGITMHTMINFPTDISLDAKDFITKLLQYNPSERLGSGIYGVEELKSHRFFHSIDWKSLSKR